MIIDAHQHFWHYNPIKHSWIDDDMAVIRRDFLPTDLQNVYKENGIDGCVAVEADQNIEETQFLLKLAEDHSFIKGVVGWVDLQSDAIESVLNNFSKYNTLKGFRHVVQAEPDHNFILRPNFLNGIAALEKYQYTYDILVFPHQLGAVLEFVRRFPNQKFVIDHIAKPYIKDGFYDGWAFLMKEIAKHENVYCKVSGMITEADYNNWTEMQLKPYLDLIFEVFGTKRIMFGSDWPVCLVAGNYSEVKNIVNNYIDTFSITEKQAIMGENAVRFYNL
ncbi:amidohydrolase [Tamlana nanhaiensis]|uniref:Amidohydrolase n=1 Tax=Neotamlana nanhaiensis TaxID=1382798 RepID=A0A0D7W961_9FLAO|nr:amidohydrolase family protein [Tamlana nanhaiensis]KJD34312.1 amidohydrolase [Tamlana nanhaiensis]